MGGRGRRKERGEGGGERRRGRRQGGQGSGRVTLKGMIIFPEIIYLVGEICYHDASRFCSAPSGRMEEEAGIGEEGRKIYRVKREAGSVGEPAVADLAGRSGDFVHV